VTCAALWPDPADESCPEPFLSATRDALERLAQRFTGSREGMNELVADLAKDLRGSGKKATAQAEADHRHRFWSEIARSGVSSPELAREGLLEFVAWASGWEQSRMSTMHETATALTRVAHEATGGFPDTRPLVVDPFAGGGAIPLEALRAGADTFASDLNPVAVLLNKVLLEHVPRHGRELADEVRRWGERLQRDARDVLARFYPEVDDGAMPIAYLWARTVTCQGPGCGAEVPLMTSLWLAKKRNRSTALRLVRDLEKKRVDFEMIRGARPSDVGDGTVRRGSATCPVCGYTTPVEDVRMQLKARHGGTSDARLITVVTTRPGEKGRFYRPPTDADEIAAAEAAKEMDRRTDTYTGSVSLVPDESLDVRGIRHTWAMLYGLDNWGSYFTPRQALALSTLTGLVRDYGEELAAKYEPNLAAAIQMCLALAVSRQADYTSSLCNWHLTGEKVNHTFGRQALPMVWDFTEVYPLSGSSGDLRGAVSWVADACEANASLSISGQAHVASATHLPLPDDSADALVTDPPYYDAVPYAYLSDFFYVWLRRSLGSSVDGLFSRAEVPKDEEIVVDRPHKLSSSKKDISFYERELTRAFSEGRRVLRPGGVSVVVFASKSTTSWEAILTAIIDAGWTITGSWPIDTEMAARVAAQGQARLASSIHIVCRPRETADGSLIEDNVGDWREVLQELPRRIHSWMPRLAEEGVVGADSIFACLGPALEIFSRYSRVEKASGEEVELSEYMEHVWAAVAREALSVILEDVDVTGFEPDARLTAMWLWTLLASTNDRRDVAEEETLDSSVFSEGYRLEYDAARKIAQGLGAHLEKLDSVVQVKGDTARLLPVTERTTYLLGKEDSRIGRQEQQAQLTMFATTDGTDEQGEARITEAPEAGSTVLDRIHQSMLLFASGRGEALRRFLVEERIGEDQRFWRLAQALSALYPAGSDEKRWVDGVLARKKGLGF
jgi:putative DNA methylase